MSSVKTASATFSLPADDFETETKKQVSRLIYMSSVNVFKTMLASFRPHFETKT